MNTVDTVNTVTTRQTARAPRKTVAEKRAEEQAARDKRDQDFTVAFGNAYSSRLLKLLHAVLTENAYGGVAAWLKQNSACKN
jgi:hypothetical protein